MRTYDRLHAEFIAAIYADPARLIHTPGFKPAQTSVADVWADWEAGTDGDALKHEALRIIVLAAQGQDAQLRAQALIAQVAKKHAAFHEGDAEASEWEETLAERHQRAQSRRFDATPITGFGAMA